MRCKLRIAVTLVLFGVLTGATTEAQTTFGTILGAVSDSTGAALAGAQVTVTNLDTNLATNVATNSAGEYNVPNLLPGQYGVAIAAPGFGKFVAQPLILLVDKKLRVDAVLQPGTVQTTVHVAASGQLIDTDSSTVGKVVENKQIVDLPLISRNFLELASLSPTTLTDPSGALRPEQSLYRTGLSGGALWVAGGRAASNAYSIDGVENNDPGFQTPTITPPIDAIQEFKLMSDNYSAEFGGSSTQMNVAIKSGTNVFHGTMYEFLRNDALNSRNFFDTAKPILRYNLFGASLGGPIVKNKLFFFSDYEGVRERQFVTATGLFPTAAELSGNFSGDLPIYDPQTGQQFNGNIVPMSQINQESQRIIALGLFPTPNVSQPGFNIQTILGTPDNIDQGNVRVDGRISDRDTVFVRVSISDQNLFTPSIAPFGGLATTQDGRNVAVSYIRQFSPRVANEFRIGLNRPISHREQQASFTDDIAGKLFNATERSPVAFGAPSFTFNGYGTIGGNPNGPLDYTTNSWSFADALTVSAGKHLLKAGADIRRFLFKEINAFNPRGSAAFTGLFTQGAGNPSGNAIADFMLGLPANAMVSQGNFASWFHGQSYNFYLQDDWKIARRLTLNLGLRYEYRTPLIEEHDRVSIFDPSFPGGRLLIPNTATADAIGSPLIAGGASPGLVDPDRNNWGPRVGFAYRPFADNNTVVRAGYGIFYDNFEFNEYSFSMANEPWQTSSALFGSLQAPIDFENLFPLPPTQLVPGTLSSLTIDKRNRTPYVQQWSLGVQHEIGKNWAVELGYVGSKSTKLHQRNLISQGDLIRSGPNPIIDFPYSNFAFILADRTDGRSTYEAFFTRVEKRFGNGLYLQTHYTFSKAVGLKSAAGGLGNESFEGPQNAWDYKSEYGPLSFDVTHRLVIDGIWELPFGRGKRFGSGGSSKALNAFIGGWQLNGLNQIQSGFPFSILATDLSGTNFSPYFRADLVGNPNIPDPVDPRRAFNRFAFAQPAPYTFGNSGRNMLRGKGLNNMDLSLLKNTQVTEKVNLQFRTEFFNALNHTQLGPYPGYTFSLDPASSFGLYTTTQHDARVVQLALKVVF